MDITEYNTIAISGSVHPHGHTDKNTGPFSLRVGIKSQPQVLQYWESSHVYLSIEQPNETDNFTLLRVLYLRSGTKKPSLVAGCVFHRAKWYRRPKGLIEVRIKKRYCNVLTHPLPSCQYSGTCMYDVGGGFVVLTLQAVSLNKEPEPQKPKIILTPGDEGFNESLANAKRTFSGTDGLAGGGANAGGLRDG